MVREALLFFGRCSILSAAVIATETCPGFAAEKVDLRRIPSGFLGKDVSLESLSANAPTVAHIFGEAAAAGFTGEDKFALERQSQTPAGLIQLHLSQSFYNIPIWGERVIVTTNKDKKAVRANGVLFRGIEKDIDSIVPQLSSEDALKKAKDAVAHARGLVAEELKFENEKSRLVIYMRPTDNVARLSYEVSFFAVLDRTSGEATRPVFLIDANTGDTLYRYEGLTNADGTGPGGNLKTGRYRYGSASTFPPLDVDQVGKNCKLHSLKVTTEDLNHATSGTGKAFQFPCFDNTVRQINGAYSPLNDAHHFGRIVYEMYRNWYNTEPLDPVKVPRLLLQVHYGTAHENAYWTGSAMLFGDGNKRFYPLVSLDVMAHEISHGLTEHHSGLIYRGQSGGINEAFSDMAGETAESYNSKGRLPDFLVGATIFKKADGALRNMCAPTGDGLSIDNAKNYYDGLDVHYSSGVFNKAFCLLAKTPGWDTRKAFHAFLVANQNYWTPTTNFTQGAQGVYDAAQDLGLSVADVQKAFAEVGIALP